MTNYERLEKLGIKAVPTQGKNECLRGAIATLLGLEYEQTPAICGSGYAGAFWTEWGQWAEERGLRAMFGCKGYTLEAHEKGLDAHEPGSAMYWEMKWITEAPEFWVACVRGTRGSHHAVVVQGERAKLIYDPSNIRERTGPASVFYGLWFEGVR